MMNLKRAHDETPKSDRRPKKTVKETASELPPLPYTRPKAIISDANGILSPRHDIGKRKGRKSMNKADSEEFRKKQCQTLLQRIDDNIALEKRNMNSYQGVIKEFSHRRSALKNFYDEICKDLENRILVNPNLDLSQLETLGYADELFSFLTMNFNDDKREVDPELFSRLNLVEKTDAENKTLINILQNNMADGLTRSQRQLEILNNFIR